MAWHFILHLAQQQKRQNTQSTVKKLKKIMLFKTKVSIETNLTDPESKRHKRSEKKSLLCAMPNISAPYRQDVGT